MFLWRSSSKCKASGTRSSDWSSVAFKLFKLHLDRASGLVLTLVQCPDESYSGLVLTLLPDTRPNPKAYPKMWSAASCARRLLLSYHTPTYHTDMMQRAETTWYAGRWPWPFFRGAWLMREDESCCFTQFTPTLTDVRTEYSFHNDVLRSLSQEGCAFKFNQTQSGISNLTTTFIEK